VQHLSIYFLFWYNYPRGVMVLAAVGRDSERIFITIKKGRLEKVKKIAEADDRTVSYIIGIMIDYYIEKNPPK